MHAQIRSDLYNIQAVYLDPSSDVERQETLNKYIKWKEHNTVLLLVTGILLVLVILIKVLCLKLKSLQRFLILRYLNMDLKIYRNTLTLHTNGFTFKTPNGSRRRLDRTYVSAKIICRVHQ